MVVRRSAAKIPGSNMRENATEREDHNRSTNYIHATTYFSFLYNQPIHRIFACVWMDCVVVTSA